MEEKSGSFESARTRSKPHRFLGLWVMVLSVAFVTAGCLMPDEYDPTGNEPVGSLDIAEAAGTSIRVVGWALDPNTTAPVNVTVAYLGTNSKHAANLSRPDVAKSYPAYGPRHGFEVVTPPLGTGVGQVCVWIENVGAGSKGRLLGCRDIPLKSDSGSGRFEAANALGPDRARVTGWGLDPELYAPVKVGYSVNNGSWTYKVADLARKDVNWVTGVRGNHGFSFDIPVNPGRNTICMRVPAYGRGSAHNMGCRTIYNDSVAPVGPGIDLLSVAPVKPAAGHPLSDMSRDGGVSTTLSDGSTMWFFGDTSGFNPDGSIRYFVNNTAAWAAPGSPTATTDAIAPGPAPFPFARPISSFQGGCPAGWSSVIWPASAVTVPQSATRDRVLVYFGNVCLGGPWKFSSRGMGVAEVVYDRTASPAAKAIQGRVLTQTLFSGSRRYGTAAYFDGEDVHVYQCSSPPENASSSWPTDFGPCTVARVDPSHAADASAYLYWAGGSTWATDLGSAAPLPLPATDFAKQFPVAGFTITADPHHGLLMVYSPWPGLTGEIAVRSAESPTGPWTSPQIYKVPGCSDWLHGTQRFCYAATAQPALSDAQRIGIGYFDDLVALKPGRGAYLGGTVAKRP